ncbi:gluconate 2-dehydrogenase subunit 3 family protein [Halococcus agarilyticus]|uniref:gluconate 2-dehydrogenase subunit 3 family protein n=1 Tax=Halococcus agarilyticus TaxID=1232219 RepID=UPI00067817B0|nr:gluconate 2-dehydrogenase subunit 3 family protein [Halococcus agarilyticus]
MELTRRDALAALAGGSVVGGGGAVAVGRNEGEPSGARTATDDGSPTAADGAFTAVRDPLVAAARVVYPDEITGIATFVETYALGRIEERSAYRNGVERAVAAIDDRSESWYGGRYASLDAESRDAVLREMGVDTADPDPEGSTAEQVRYYVVNELLYALYTSPAGGKLVGIENPQGHPGGHESYQHGPR